VFMLHLFENFDLSDGTALPLNVNQLILVIDFDCESLSSLLMDGFLHDSICPLPKIFAHSILSNASEIKGSKFRSYLWQKLVWHCVFIMG
jgi:hypothetical protein